MKNCIFLCLLPLVFAGIAQADATSVTCQSFGKAFSYGFTCTTPSYKPTPESEAQPLLDSDNLPIRYEVTVCKGPNDTAAATTIILESIRGYAPNVSKSWSLLRNVNGCNACGGNEVWAVDAPVAGDFVNPFLNSLTVSFDPGAQGNAIPVVGYFTDIAVNANGLEYDASCGGHL